MKFYLDFDIPILERKIEHTDKILLLGSCFTENIAEKLMYYKYDVLSNPLGILYNPASLAKSIGYITGTKKIHEKDIIEYNNLYHHFDFHSTFSNTNKTILLNSINDAFDQAQAFIQNIKHVIISLGSAFVYRNIERNELVANNHKLPSNHFTKELLSIDQIEESLQSIMSNIKILNKDASFIFTISPIRHIKDGVIENNQSKARLIEAVQKIVQKESYYFPSYEILIDQLRDYRFYTNDLVHPNAQAIDFIWDKFNTACLSEKNALVYQLLDKLNKNLDHRPINPATEMHHKFKAGMLAQINHLQEQYPYLDFTKELERVDN